MSWNNGDGLYVKFGNEQGVVNRGGTYNVLGPLQCTEVKIDYREMLSATAAIVGSVAVGTTAAGQAGSAGVIIPAGVRIEKVEVIAEDAFTSSGVIGSAALEVGLVRLDRTTAYDADGLVDTLAGSALDAAGEITTLTTAAQGSLITTTTAYAGYIVAANSAHGSHPFTAGKVIVRVYWYNPQTLG